MPYQPSFFLQRTHVVTVNLLPVNRSCCIELIHYLPVYLEKPKDSLGWSLRHLIHIYLNIALSRDLNTALSSEKPDTALSCVEPEFLHEDIRIDGGGQADYSFRLVVIQDGLKGRSAPVEEVLLPLSHVELLNFLGT